MCNGMYHFSKQTEDEKAKHINHVIANNATTSTDYLTGLLDTEGFYEEGRNPLSKDDSNWSLVVYNLNNFKVINEVYTREKGNEILIKIGELINKRLKDDEICARLRADRFAVLIHKDSFNDDFLLPELNSLDLLDNNLYSLNLQAGIYEIDNKDMPISSMIDRSNIVLSSLKEHHYAKYATFDEDVLENMKKEKEIIDNCEKAIANKEFKMYLQPQVLKNGKVVGCEALARWQKQDGTIIMPSAFIPIMEKNSSIVKLDTYIWEEAIKQLDNWKDTNNKDLFISINISPKDFFYIDVFEYFEELITKYRVDKKKLKLEITESIMMNDENKQLANIEKLHRAGYIIAIDDFGKGYSSLSLLKDLSADALKIDKDFLKEIDSNQKSESILKSLIDMSNNLNMKVVTEGVETKQQLDKLSNLGCNYFQGFYFAKPMSINEFEEYINMY